MRRVADVNLGVRTAPTRIEDIATRLDVNALCRHPRRRARAEHNTSPEARPILSPLAPGGGELSPDEWSAVRRFMVTDRQQH